MSRVHRVFTYPENVNLNAAPLIPLAPASKHHPARGTCKPLQKLWSKDTSEEFEAKATEALLFESLPERAIKPKGMFVFLLLQMFH